MFGLLLTFAFKESLTHQKCVRLSYPPSMTLENQSTMCTVPRRSESGFSLEHGYCHVKHLQLKRTPYRSAAKYFTYWQNHPEKETRVHVRELQES